jgi:hypothetical protein
MWADIMLFVLKISLQLLPVFFGKSKKKAEYERLVKASISTWEKRTGRSAKLREEHRKVDEKLNEKHKEKWSKVLDVTKPSIKIVTYPIIANKPFVIITENIQAGKEIYADKEWKLATTTPMGHVRLILTSPGKRTIDVKLGDEWISKTIIVNE